MYNNFDIIMESDNSYIASRNPFKILKLKDSSYKAISQKNEKAQEYSERKENIEAAFNNPVSTNTISVDTNSINNNKFDKANVNALEFPSDATLVSKKPIKLIPKMYGPIYGSYNVSVKEVVEKKTVDDVLASYSPVYQEVEKHHNDTLDKFTLAKAPVEEKVDSREKVEEPKKANLFDFEDRLNKALEEVASKSETKTNNIIDFSDYKKAISEKEESHENKIVDISNYMSKKNENADITSVKEQLLNVRKRLEEESAKLEQAEQAKIDIERKKMEAQKAQAEAINRLIEQTRVEQEKLDKNMARISELEDSIEKESASVDMINKENEDLLAMLIPEEEESYKRKVA